MKDPFEKFVANHPRDPHPDKLTWEMLNAEHDRAHWLIIDQLGSQPDDAKQLPDLNLMRDPDPLPGSNASLFPLFDRSKPSGRVDLTRVGNTIEAATKGVAAFTLLLSPD